MENQILPVENVLNIYPQSMVQEEKREEDNVIIMNYLNQDKNERGAVYICQNDGNLVLFEYDDLNTKIKKTTTKLESFSGIQYCSNEVERLYPYFDGYDFTVQDSIDCANQELGKFFPDYNLDLDIMWVTIVPNTRPCYVCTLRQKIDGIPILMGAGDIARGTNEKEMGFKFPKSWKTKGEEYWGGFIRSLWDFIAYVDGGYQIQFRPLKKVVSLVDDVPLCTFDEVISSVEKQIEHGNIRNVYEMRFGYCCYLDENEQIVLYPVWQIECDYFFNPKEEQKHYAEMEDGQVTLGLDANGNPVGDANYDICESALGRRASHGCVRVQRQANADGYSHTWLWNNLRGQKNVKIIIWDDDGRKLTETDASTPMYYNKNGGKKYHTNARCSSVKSRYLPLSAITYGDLSSYPYTQLSPCTTCGAPERPEVVSAWNSVIDEAYAELGLTGEK